MKPEDIARAGTEHAHQAALFCWANKRAFNDWPELKWLYAIPNGGERNIAVAARMKAEGVKSGVSDLCLPIARRGYHSLYVEMKKPGGGSGESANQKEFGAFLKEQGSFYICCDNWIDAARIISWYMGKDDGTY